MRWCPDLVVGHDVRSADPNDSSPRRLQLAADERGIDPATFPAHTRRMGTLYYGDNLDILRRYLKDETVDLVYLDPPFNSAQNYNAFFQEKDGTAAASQIHAFEDTWHWDIETKKAYDAVTEQPGKVSDVMQAFYTFLGGNDMMAYLTMMSSRLVELRRVLKPTGSLYLHCDPTASHYLKLLCDAILGKDNFRNEIIWQRTSSHNDSKKWMDVHDVLLYYAKSDDYLWNPTFTEHDPDYVKAFYRYEDEDEVFIGSTISFVQRQWDRVRILLTNTKAITPDWGWRTVREKLEALDKRQPDSVERFGSPLFETIFGRTKRNAN